MISLAWRAAWHGDKLAKRLDTTTFKTIGHAAAALRLTAKRSIRRSRQPAAPGQPVHTQTSRLPRAIVYHADRKRFWAVIGPAKTKAGPVGATHEHGGRLRDETYPPRPFMRPATEKIAPRLPACWAAAFPS